MVTTMNSASRNLDNQLKTRRKVAKMLIAVVIMFSINFFPVHFLPVLQVCNSIVCTVQDIYPLENCSLVKYPCGQKLNEALCFYRCLLLRTFGPLDIWIAGHLVLWILIPLDTCSFGHLFLWTFASLDNCLLHDYSSEYLLLI